MTAARPARGEVELPAGKSHAIRAAWLAAQARGVSTLDGLPRSDDVDRALAWIAAAGVAVERRGGRATIAGLGAAPRFDGRFHAGDAGAVLRMGLFWLASGAGRATVDGSAALGARPIEEGLRWLRRLGAGIRGEGLPLEVEARGLAGGRDEAEAEATSQFLSGRLLAAPSGRDDLELHLPERVPSDDHVASTLRMLERFGVPARRERLAVRVAASAPLAASPTLEPDASLRIVFACVPAMLGGRVRLRRAALAPRDRGWEALARAGTAFEVDGDALVVTGAVRAPLELDGDGDPDLVPPLVVVALLSPGASRFRNVGRLRAKESDRLAALEVAARELGGVTRREGADLVVEGGKRIRPARLATRGDHRLAMSFALAKLVEPGIEIDDPGCVAKSAADFFPMLEAAVG